MKVHGCCFALIVAYPNPIHSHPDPLAMPCKNHLYTVVPCAVRASSFSLSFSLCVYLSLSLSLVSLPLFPALRSAPRFCLGPEFAVCVVHGLKSLSLSLSVTNFLSLSLLIPVFYSSFWTESPARRSGPRPGVGADAQFSGVAFSDGGVVRWRQHEAGGQSLP